MVLNDRVQMTRAEERYIWGEKRGSQTSWSKCAVIKGQKTSPLVWGRARAQKTWEKILPGPDCGGHSARAPEVWTLFLDNEESLTISG